MKLSRVSQQFREAPELLVALAHRQCLVNGRHPLADPAGASQTTREHREKGGITRCRTRLAQLIERPAEQRQTDREVIAHDRHHALEAMAARNPPRQPELFGSIK